MKHSVRLRRLRETLNKLEIPSLLNDPVRYVRGFGSRQDLEVGGFIISSVAYGRIEQIMRDTRLLLDIIGDGPAEYVANFNEEQAGSLFEFKHRFTRGTHVACLILRLNRALEDYGSLYALFHEGWSRSPDTRSAITHFVSELRSYDCPGFCDDCGTPRRQSVRWLLSEPRNGSAAKRMCLYLRWMVRDTYPDIGVWSSIPKSALVIPLDTHVARIGRFLGLTQRRSSDWATAAEITRALKQLDPEDPLRYDYPLSHLGIDGRCSGKFNVATCVACNLNAFCDEVA